MGARSKVTLVDLIRLLRKCFGTTDKWPSGFELNFRLDAKRWRNAREAVQ